MLRSEGWVSTEIDPVTKLTALSGEELLRQAGHIAVVVALIVGLICSYVAYGMNAERMFAGSIFVSSAALAFIGVFGCVLSLYRHRLTQAAFSVVTSLLLIALMFLIMRIATARMVHWRGVGTGLAIFSGLAAQTAFERAKKKHLSSAA